MDERDEFVKATLDTLPEDAIEDIILRMDPVSVAKLCQAANVFSQLCNMPQLWRRLMRKHFPTQQINDDPRRQFINLTNISYYNMSTDGGYYLGGMILAHGSTVEFNSTGIYDEKKMETKLAIFGPRAEPGTQVWVVATVMEMNEEYNSNYNAFENREDAREFAILEAKEGFRLGQDLRGQLDVQLEFSGITEINDQQIESAFTSTEGNSYVLWELNDGGDPLGRSFTVELILVTLQ